MKKLVLTLAFVALLGALSLGLSASTAQANTIHYCDQEDNGGTEVLALGDDILLDLGNGYTWDVSVTDPFGRAPVLEELWWVNGNPSEGYFHSIGYGQSTIRAYGTPNCGPQCGAPPKLFTLTVVIQ